MLSSVAPFIFSTHLFAATILKCGEDVFKYSNFFGYFPDIQHRVDADWVPWCDGERVFSNLGVKCGKLVEMEIDVTVKHTISMADLESRKISLEEEYSEYKTCFENGGERCAILLFFSDFKNSQEFFENFPSAKKYVEEKNYQIGQEVDRQEATTVKTKRLEMIDFLLKKRTITYDNQAVNNKLSSITNCSDQF